MEEFNLHMTGDIHAITAANNLFAAAIDTRIFHEATASTRFIFDKLCPPAKDGTRSFEPSMYARLDKLGIKTRDPSQLSPAQIEAFCRLDIDPSSVTWKRVTDTNDRFLRQITLGRGPAECHSKTGARYEAPPEGGRTRHQRGVEPSPEGVEPAARGWHLKPAGCCASAEN